jgi:2'-hydroxyisoflavone reductase
VQFVDGRDLGAWLVTLVEGKTGGVYNALGPEQPLRIKDFLAACASVVPSPATPVWVPAEFLEKHEVLPWQEMPMWIPSSPEAVYNQLSNRAAVGKGLRFRPAADTARDTLGWWKTLPEERRAKLRAGLDPEKEKRVLEAWKASRPG